MRVARACPLGPPGHLKRASSLGLLDILPMRPLAAVRLGKVHDALDHGGLSKRKVYRTIHHVKDGSV
jgi:hypothetical protein